MKKYLLLVFLFNPAFLWAQKNDIKSSYLESTTQNVIDELVTAAWENYPENKKYDHQVKIAEKNVIRAGYSWLDNIYGTGNLNEFTLNPPSDFQGNLFFPRYNFGVRINLGTFVTVPAEKKIAKEELRIAELNRKQQKIMIRAEVLRRYNRFLMHRSMKCNPRPWKMLIQITRLLKKNLKRVKLLLKNTVRLLITTIPKKLKRSMPKQIMK